MMPTAAAPATATSNDLRAMTHLPFVDMEVRAMPASGTLWQR
jgi:hypothetical protein